MFFGYLMEKSLRHKSWILHCLLMMYIIFSINLVNLNFSEGRKMVGLLGTFKFGLKIARFSCYNSFTKPMSFLYACLFLQDVWRGRGSCLFRQGVSPCFRLLFQWNHYFCFIYLIHGSCKQKWNIILSDNCIIMIHYHVKVFYIIK